MASFNVNVQNSSAQGGSNFYAGINLHGDIVTGEASLQERVVEWLQPKSAQNHPSSTQNRLRSQRTPGTGVAFLEKEYFGWLKSQNRLLWLHGEGMLFHSAKTVPCC
jgi:hypothetical protein